MGDGRGTVEGVVTQGEARNPDARFWRSRRVLVTGHTGFKGSWLACWLSQLGAEVHGLALEPPTEPNLFDLARVGASLASDSRVDLRDAGAVTECVSRITPEIVFHLAAQSLVRRSYAEPAVTFATNVMGTVNLLMQPFPEWRVSPFFTLGTGILHVEPQTTIVQSEDRTDEVAHVGVGANLYLGRRFVFSVEYKHHTVLTSRDDNQEIDEWKAGFSVFL